MASVPKPGWTTKARILRVIDGDTVEVEVRRVIEIRLLDCWAPESRIDPRVSEEERPAEKKKGLVSKRSLQGLAPAGSGVTVHIPTQEDGSIEHIFTLGRALGYVWADAVPDQSLSEIQVAMGNATKTKEITNAVANVPVSDFVVADSGVGRRRKAGGGAN